MLNPIPRKEKEKERKGSGWMVINSLITYITSFKQEQTVK